MWCPYCQDDTPVVASEGSHPHYCAQCNRPLEGNTGSSQQDAQPASKAADDPIWDAFDEAFGTAEEAGRQGEKSQRHQSSATPDQDEQLWKKWEENLAELDELLWQAEAATMGEAEAANLPIGSQQPLPPSQPQPAASSSAPTPLVRRAAGTRIGRMLVAVGMTVFGAGTALSIWALVGEQPGWWGVGLPLCLAGQTLLLVGLAVQVESTWAEQRAAQEVVARLRDDLERIERATTLLAGSHSLPAQSFYVHFAQRASPHILLADLKNQLDLLTMRLADHGRSS